MRSITIKNFGPIKNVTLDLDKQYNVLIGPQATGKSTAAKCITFFSGIAEYFGDELAKKSHSDRVPGSEELIVLLHDVIRDKFLDSFSEKFLCDDTLIRYDYGEDMWLEIQFLDRRLLTKISNGLERRLKVIFEADQASRVSENYESAFDRVTVKMWIEGIKEIFGDETVIYIPAGRSTMSAMINSNIFTKEAVGSSDFALANYLSHVRKCKDKWNKMGLWGFGKPFYNEEICRTLQGRIKEFEKISKKIIKGKYTIKQEEDYIHIGVGRSIPIAFASSGQQEVLWIINLLKMVLLEQTKTMIVIEEPEAHLYPDAQFELVKLVALVANCTYSKIFVTTHSPYILSVFNLLLHSAYVENNADVKAKSKTSIIENDFRINPGLLVANKIEDGGEITNLVSGARCMVDILAIDGISEIINGYTDKLINREIRYGL